MDSKTKNSLSWLLLFAEAFFYVMTCAGCINYGVAIKDWMYVAAGVITLGLGAWRACKRGKALWNEK